MTTDISVGVRWDPINQQNETINQDDYEFEYDGGNSSSRLFERSRIKALAGMTHYNDTIIRQAGLMGIRAIFNSLPPLSNYHKKPIG